MNHTLSMRVCFLVLLAAVSIAGCVSIPTADMDAAAVASLRAMSVKLASARALQFESRNSYDAALAKHLGIPPSATARISVKRPRHLHGRIDHEGEGSQDVHLDGKTLTIHDGKHNLYAIAEINRPGIDKALDAISEYYGFSPPLADFVIASPFKGLTKKMQSGRHLGVEIIDGDECEHLAFSGVELDWELWIATKDQLPRRYVVTAKSHEGNPQFTASFLSWNLDADLPESLFDFRPPEGAFEIEMIRVKTP